MKVFGVIGNPISHSLSPQLHQAAFEYHGIDARYLRFASFSAEEGFQIAHELQLSGFNVTAPFKEDARRLVNELDPVAEATGAVNTVLPGRGGALGYNTDSFGVTESLKNSGVTLSSSDALVVGSGGAARSAVWGLKEAGARVTVANRTTERAKGLAAEYGCDYCSLSADDLKEALSTAEVIVLAISTESSVLPPELLRDTHTILDANYRTPSALIESAGKVGAKLISGREWLLYQGVRAFELFTGAQAPVEIMRSGLERGSTTSKKRNVSLIGMMGSGKSTVAGKISALTTLSHIDTDERIESRGVTIAEIFRNEGEKGFRALERSTIADLKLESNSVISVGGGAVLAEANSALLREISEVIWLWCEPETLKGRLMADRGRPLLESTERGSRIEELLKERVQRYIESCDLVVSTGANSPESIAERIINEYRLPRAD